MEKLEKYSSFEEMKDSSTTRTVSDLVLMKRQEKFESFIHFLRGEDLPKESPSEDQSTLPR